MIWLAALVLILLCLYLFLIAPNMIRKKPQSAFFSVHTFAHRGLHNEEAGIPENSLAAFARAAEKGYGIELDVHLSKDHQLVVHHDRSLHRMCGVDENIDQLPLHQIRTYHLSGTQEKIPTLDEVLSLVNGRVPLMIEMKSDGGENHGRLPELLNQRMTDYKGPYCVESFDPLLIRWYKKKAPHVIRGQLALDQRLRDGKYRSVSMILLAHLLMHFLSRPDFVAYHHKSQRNISFRILRCLFRPPIAAWTVRSQEAFDQLRSQWDWQIFEGFEP